MDRVCVQCELGPRELGFLTHGVADLCSGIMRLLLISETDTSSWDFPWNHSHGPQS